MADLNFNVNLNAKNVRDAKLSPEQRKLKTACREFESVMTGMMLKQMRSAASIGKQDNSNAMRTYRDMLDDAMARDISTSGGMGVADVLYKQLSKNME